MILVTGATGLLGSHLLYSLTLDGNKVRAAYRNQSRIDGVKKVFSYYGELSESQFELIEWVQGDLTDPYFIDELVKGCERVYHCAAIVSFNPKDKDRVIKQNINIAADIAAACLEHGVEKLCHVSSTAATGKKTDGTEIDENCQWKSSKRNSAYSVSKHYSEVEVWKAIAHGLNAVIVNPSMIIGPGNWGESSTELIEKTHKGLKFYSTGINSYVDVRDVVKSMTQLMKSDISGERYLVTSENISFKDFFNMTAKELGVKPPTIKAQKWMAELLWRLEKVKYTLTGLTPIVTRETAKSAMSKHRYSSQKIKDAIGIDFISVEDSLKYTCRHFLNDANKK